MATRALIRSDDLRRWAKVAREEGVTINGRLDPSGTLNIVVSANPQRPFNDATDGDDLNAQCDAYGAM